MKIGGAYQLVDGKGKPLGGLSKEPILQSQVSGLMVRFTSDTFTGGPYNCDIPPIRIWGDEQKGAEAVITTDWEWSEERKMDLCLYSYVVTGSNPQAVETQRAIVEYRLGVGEKPANLIL